eukprot:g21861.t1
MAFPCLPNDLEFIQFQLQFPNAVCEELELGALLAEGTPAVTLTSHILQPMPEYIRSFLARILSTHPATENKKAAAARVDSVAVMILSKGKCGLSKSTTHYLVALADLMVIITEVIMFH